MGDGRTCLFGMKIVGIKNISSDQPIGKCTTLRDFLRI